MLPADGIPKGWKGEKLTLQKPKTIHIYIYTYSSIKRISLEYMATLNST